MCAPSDGPLSPQRKVELARFLIALAIDLIHSAGMKPSAADHLLDALRDIEDERPSSTAGDAR